MRTGYAVEISLTTYRMAESQVERDSGKTTRRRTLYAHYDGSRTEAQALALYEALNALMEKGHSSAKVAAIGKVDQ